MADLNMLRFLVCDSGRLGAELGSKCQVLYYSVLCFFKENCMCVGGSSDVVSQIDTARIFTVSVGDRYRVPAAQEVRW